MGVSPDSVPKGELLRDESPETRDQYQTQVELTGIQLSSPM